MSFWVTVALWAATWLINKWLAPDPTTERQKAAKFGDFALPRHAEDSAMPIFWGKVKIKSPILVWCGGWLSQAVVVDGHTVGYAYRVSMQFILGVPGSATSVNDPQTKCNRMEIGDRAVLGSGPMAGPDDWNQLDQASFFGGYGRGGGIGGSMAFYPGSLNQQYEGHEAGDDFVEAFEDAAFDPTLLPNYRGQAMVTLRNFEIGESPNFPGVSFIATAPTRVPLTGYPNPIRELLSGDANPVAVLHDILCSKWAKLGYSADRIDNDSFWDAAETLRTEKHGFSMVVYNANDAREVIHEICAEIGGFIFVDPETGKVKIKLVREDYDVGTLPVFNASNCLQVVSYAASSWTETYNAVRVVFTDRNKGFSERTAYAQNQANIANQGGRVRSVEYKYPGVADAELAMRLASRELDSVSIPLAKIRVILNRDGCQLRPGDVFKFTWPDYGITNRIFRVQRFDLGKLDANSVAIDAIEDRFSVGVSVFDPLDWDIFTGVPPLPIQERAIQEAPRWIQLQAYTQGQVNSPDVQRLYHPAVPADAVSDWYGVHQSLDGGTVWDADTDHVIRFPGRALVDTAYSRALDPYDTATGLVIKDIVGYTPASAGVVAIQNQGKNLFLIGTELCAYESATDLGSGRWRLNNVWRGLLDTAPQTHPVDTRIYFLHNALLSNQSTELLGENGFALNDMVSVKLTPGDSLTFLGIDEVDTDVITVRTRYALPYPGADLTVNASKTPTALEEGGVDVAWRRRDRLKTYIVRGDTASEAPEDGTVYAVETQKGTDPKYLMEGVVDGTSVANVSLGKSGHGLIDVSLRSRLNILVENLSSWQDPEIQIEAKFWRNLGVNARFTDGLDRWTTVTGTPAVGTSSSEALGGAGSYLTYTGNPAAVEVAQSLDLTGYLPPRLRAILDFYDKMLTGGDANDTFTVHLEALDVSDVVLQTVTQGPTIPGTTWFNHMIEMTTVPAGTVKLKIRVISTSVGELDSPSAILTEFILRLGQISDELITNGSFEAGPGIVGWTNVVNSFTVEGSAYIGNNRVRGGDFANSEIKQEVAIPAGYQFGTIVFECARVNGAADDTGAVTIEVLDGASAVVATVTTGQEAITPTGTWVRRRLTLEIPGTGVTIRTRLIAVRVTGSAHNSAWDNLTMRIHKHLDPDYTITIDPTVGPKVQRLPKTRSEWRLWHSAIPYPTLAMWDGSASPSPDYLKGGLGTEPEMRMTHETGPWVRTDARFIGPWDGTSCETTCMEFLGESADADADASAEGPVATFANFKSDDPFTAMCVFKGRMEAVSAVRGLLGRLGVTGWSLEMVQNGVKMVGRARLVGLTTKQVQGSTDLNDGAPHFVAIVHDPVAALLHLIDDTGDHTVSTVGLGQIRLDTLDPFRIGRADVTQTTCRGQIARVYLWREALTNAQLQAFWTHGEDPLAGQLSVNRSPNSKVLVTRLPYDAATGERMGAYSPTQWAFDYRDEGTASWGLVTHPTIQNLCPSTWHDNDEIWNLTGGASVILKSLPGVEGFEDATLVSSNDSTGGFECAGIALNAVPSVLVVWWAKATSSHGASVTLRDDNGNVKGTHDYTVTTEWEMYSAIFDAWDAATTTGRIRFHGSDDGTTRAIYLDSLVHVSQDTRLPNVFCRTRSGVIAEVLPTRIAYLPDLAAQANHEGEVVVQGVLMEDVQQRPSTLINVKKTGDDKDRRQLRVRANMLQFDHWDGASSPVKKEVKIPGPAWGTSGWTVRGRWCRAGLFDHDSVFAGALIEGANASYSRLATFASTLTPITSVDIGNESERNDSFVIGSIRGVTISSREEKLALVPERSTTYKFHYPERAFVKPRRNASGVVEEEEWAEWVGASSMAIPEALYLMEDPDTTCRDSFGSNNLTHGANVFIKRKAAGLWDGRRWDGVGCVEYPNSTTNSRSVAPNNTMLEPGTGNFGGYCIFRSPSMDAVQDYMLGKATAGLTGYTLATTAAGVPLLYVEDVDGVTAKQNVLSSNHEDGAWHYLVWWFNQDTNQMRIYSDLDKPAAEAISVNLDDITSAAPFSIGSSHSGQRSSPFQYALVAIFGDDITNLDDTAAFDALWARLMTTGIPGITYTKTSSIGTEIAHQAGHGVLHNISGPGQVAYAHRANFAHASEMGLQISPQVQNLFPEADCAKSAWAVTGTIVKTSTFQTVQTSSDFDGPQKQRWCARGVKAAAGDSLRQMVSLTSGNLYSFSVLLKVTDTANVPVLEIKDATLTTSLATLTCSGMVANEWQWFTLTYTAAATASHGFLIHPHTIAATTGTCFMAFGQLETGYGRRPFSYSNGTAKTLSTLQAQTVEQVCKISEGRVTMKHVVDVRPTASSMIMDTPSTTDRKAHYVDSTPTLAAQHRDGAAAIAHSANVAFTVGAENTIMTQWEAAGPDEGESDFNGTVATTAGTHTPSGTRQVFNFGTGLSPAVAAVIGEITITEVFI